MTAEQKIQPCTRNADTLVWAKDCESKDLIRRVGANYVQDLQVHRVMDFASGKCEEITQVCPDAQEYVFLDSHFLPAQQPGYRLIKQPASQTLPLDDESLDLVSTNGSFDHFRQEDRVAAFLEIERVLRPGGRLLFACEYMDFDPKLNDEYFTHTQTDQGLRTENCQVYDNINLPQIIARLTRLRICQRDQSQLPDGRALRELRSPDEAKRYSATSKSGLLVTWGSFFVLFEKE